MWAGYGKISQRENMYIGSEGSHLMGHCGFTTIGSLDHKYSIQEYHFGHKINLLIHEIFSIFWYSRPRLLFLANRKRLAIFNPNSTFNKANKQKKMCFESNSRVVANTAPEAAQQWTGTWLSKAKKRDTNHTTLKPIITYKMHNILLIPMHYKSSGQSDGFWGLNETSAIW